MRSPFVRFAVIFVVCVLVAFGAFLYWRSTQTTSATFVPPVQPKPSPSGPALQPKEIEAPPDINGLDYSEVAVPGSDFTASPPAVPSDYVSDLLTRKLAAPIEGLQAKDLSDTFSDVRGGGRHEASDIMEPTGTPVHALGQGNIVKLFNSKKGGLTIYQFDDAQKYCFYYAHLDKYAEGIREGMLVRPGQVIAYVGSTGDASAVGPHLHFAISLLDPDKKYWKGTPLDPYPVLQKVVTSTP